jgi:hypothetical protein
MDCYEQRLIKDVLDNGLAPALLDVMNGESEYSDSMAYNKMDAHSRRLYTMARMHLEFIIKYGNDKDSVRDGSHVYSNFKNFFEAWQLAGLPGISLELLEKMLKDKVVSKA